MMTQTQQKYVQINQKVRQIALQPEKTLPLSRKVLKLLVDIPRNGNAKELVEAAENIRWGVRKLYSDPKTRMEAAGVAEEINSFIRTVEPVYDSIH